MCGIVGAIGCRNITPVLMEGLRRLEYRGYDSAGIAICDQSGRLQRIRSVGKVASLQERLDARPIHGELGIAHTRWATHGIPAERNAHPHMSGERVAVVHNGIIENHAELRAELEKKGYRFVSETDTEVIAHLLASELEAEGDLERAFRKAVSRLVGAYALAVSSPEDPDRILVARAGSPLVIGVGKGEHFIASDVFALLPETQDFIFLEEGDWAEIRRDSITIYDRHDNPVERPVTSSKLSASAVDKGPYKHYMLKEIFEQPGVIAETLEGRIYKGKLLEESFGHVARELLD
ncbi:MAG: glutamine--fructose-6-phosphate aminotransferase, partial [Gammaproteobacteria bacterium]